MKVQQLDMQLKPQATEIQVGFVPAVSCRAVRAESGMSSQREKSGGNIFMCETHGGLDL